MNRSGLDVVGEKKGVAEGLGAVLLVITLLVAVGAVVLNYAVLSKKASQLQSVTQEILNRAERFAGELNSDLADPPMPSRGRECSPVTKVCTEVISATLVADGSKQVLRIEGDATGGLGESITRDVTLAASTVTHVTDIDVDGNNIWALSGEGLRFNVWGVAQGTPTDISPEDLAGPATDNEWRMVDDRAGVDTKGALWVWGANDIGQAGVGAASETPLSPVRISTPSQRFRSVVTNDDRAYAIDSKGALWVWGKNDVGQLGLGTTSRVMEPTKVPGITVNTVAIGRDYAMAIDVEGQLLHTGARPRGFTASAGTSFAPLDAGTRYKAVAASIGNGGSALIRRDGVLVVNGAVAGGVGTTTFETVARGTDAGYAISTAGDLYSWGGGADGQLARTDDGDRETPRKVSSTLKFADVQGTRSAVLAIDVHGGLHYSGSIAFAKSGAGNLPQVGVLTPFMPEVKFRSLRADDDNSTVALLDNAGVLYGMSTALDGLWSIGHASTHPLPIRMPEPAGFDGVHW